MDRKRIKTSQLGRDERKRKIKGFVRKGKSLKGKKRRKEKYTDKIRGENNQKKQENKRNKNHWETKQTKPNWRNERAIKKRGKKWEKQGG